MSDAGHNPYAAPVQPEPWSPQGGLGGGYRSAATLVVVLSALLALQALLSAVGLWSDVMELELLGTWPSIDPVAAEANDQRQSLIAAAQTIANLTTIVVFATFLHRSSANAHVLSDEPLTFTPGWTVGWFFVPFANLVKPYQAVREIWLVSAPQDPERPVLSGSGPLPIWWALWLLTGITGQIVFRMRLASDDSTGIDRLMTIDRISVASQVLDVALCGVALLVVRGIFSRQEEKARRAWPSVAL